MEAKLSMNILGEFVGPQGSQPYIPAGRSDGFKSVSSGVVKSGSPDLIKTGSSWNSVLEKCDANVLSATWKTLLGCEEKN